MVTELEVWKSHCSGELGLYYIRRHGVQSGNKCDQIHDVSFFPVSTLFRGHLTLAKPSLFHLSGSPDGTVCRAQLPGYRT